MTTTQNTSTLAYSTTTGSAPVVSAAVADELFDITYDPFCFVCSRCTDHFGEHDALVEAGMAVYDNDGSVRTTEAWDADEARKIADNEYREFLLYLTGEER